MTVLQTIAFPLGNLGIIALAFLSLLYVLLLADMLFPSWLQDLCVVDSKTVSADLTITIASTITRTAIIEGD